MLTVVMQHGEIQCVNTLKVFGIKNMLGSGAVDGFSPEVRLKQPQDRPEYRHTRQAELTALFFQSLDKILFEQGVENQARRLCDFRQSMVELLFRPHHWVQVFDRRYIGVLRRGGSGNRYQGFAGGVGNQMKMEITGLRHLYSGRIACGY